MDPRTVARDETDRFQAEIVSLQELGRSPGWRLVTECIQSALKDCNLDAQRAGTEFAFMRAAISAQVYAHIPNLLQERIQLLQHQVEQLKEQYV